MRSFVFLPRTRWALNAVRARKASPALAKKVMLFCGKNWDKTLLSAVLMSTENAKRLKDILQFGVAGQNDKNKIKILYASCSSYSIAAFRVWGAT